MASRVCNPKEPSTDMGNTSGSTKMSPIATPAPRAASTIRDALSIRSAASDGIPAPPAAVTITRAPYSTARSTASTRSREAELSIGRPSPVPAATDRPDSMTVMSEESTEIGSVVNDRT